MRRREFITLLGGVAAWPLAAGAQQTAVPVIGDLSSTSPGQFPRLTAAFGEGLKQGGYIEGQNIVIEQRHADWHGRPPASPQAGALSATDAW